MARHVITTLTINRAQLADLFAESERRIRTGEAKQPPSTAGLTIAEAGVVTADYLITLACQQAVVDFFDRDAYLAGHQSGQVDSGPAMLDALWARVSPGLPRRGLQTEELMLLQGFTPGAAGSPNETRCAGAEEAR